ncbi:MAG: tetratricopeptide repeat protein [Pseudomonadota bacterium]
MNGFGEWLERVLKDQQEEIAAALLVAALLGLWAWIRRRMGRKAPPPASPAPPPQTVKVEVEHKPAPVPEPKPDPRLLRPERPNSLGRSNPDFTGRTEDIAKVFSALNSGHRASIVGITGMGGIGKTALAEVVGHRLMDEGRFPDGAVKVDLRGFSETPMSPRDALILLLGEVGDPVGQLPDMDEAALTASLAGRWRTATSGKDMLVLLDNASRPDQIADLMPGDGPTVIATSRKSLNLTGGAEVDLDFITEKDATELISRLAPDLTGIEIGRLRKIADGLPLMIEVAAQAVNRSPRSAEEVLTDYEALTAEDYDERIRRRLAYSVDQLGEEDAAAWAALSQFEGGVFANYAAIMWGVEEAEAARWFDRFHDRRLVIPMPELPYDVALGRRWRLHDHLRALAADRLEESALADAARDGWLTASEKMMATAGQMYDRHGEWIEVGLALLDADLHNIRAAAEVAGAIAAKNDAAARVAMRLPNHAVLDLRLIPAERLRWLEAGLSGARKYGDASQEAILLGNAAHRHYVLGDFVRAEVRYREAIEMDERSGRREGLAANYGNLGVLLRAQGDLGEAERMFRASLVLDESAEDKAGMADNFSEIAIVMSLRGDYDAAEEMLRSALALNEELDRKQGLAVCHMNLGAVAVERGDLESAEALFRKALGLEEALGRDEGVAGIYGNLGALLRKRGDLEEAEKALLKSIRLNETLGRKQGMANQYGNLALVYRDTSRPDEAVEAAERAAALFSELGGGPNVMKAEAIAAEIRASIEERG